MSVVMIAGQSLTMEYFSALSLDLRRCTLGECCSLLPVSPGQGRAFPLYLLPAHCSFSLLRV